MAGLNLYREPLTLDEAARAGLPGQFVKLPDGVTHYELAGPPEGQPVVLIHGFSTPYHLWDPTFQPLAEAGFRTLRYDLYGRGYSDRPDVTYNDALFDRQLLHLLDALGITAPADLVGISMGAAIAVNFADRHPQRVRRLALIGPVGFAINPSLAALALFTPVLGEVLMALAGDRIIIDGLARDFHRPQDHPEYVEKYRPQMQYRGFKRALLSTMRNMKLTGLAEVYRRVGQQGRPVLLLWGREDESVPLAAHNRVQEAIPQAEFHAIDEAGHVAHYERPEVANPLLIDFLRR